MQENPSKRFVLVDDDPDILAVLKMAIEIEGHEVTTFTSSVEALEVITQNPPDCVVLDIMMPEMDGVELCRRLRAQPDTASLCIAVVSGKIYQPDRQRALDAGANGFIAKSRTDPYEMYRRLMALFNTSVSVCFWGTRGTIPVPGPDTLRYGGNTACVSLTFPDDHIFIFDAGTGIKPLGNSLVKAKKKTRGTIFISHPHWDHLNFLPFFAPLYIPGNHFTITGPASGSVTLEQLVANQMDGLHFPITPREFGARVDYQDITEGQFKFGPATVKTMLLCHPGTCLGYAVHYGGLKLCYVTDNELFPEDSDMYSANYEKLLAEFVAEADLLITDVTYRDEEYPSRIGWGHSSVSAATSLAHQAKVKELYLFHHDPDQDDEAIAEKLQQARQSLVALNSMTKVRVAAAEQVLELTSDDQ
ncbi:MAG: response regulator [Vulcanimicrobiota bacterium]